MRRPRPAPGVGLRLRRERRQALKEAEATRPEVLPQAATQETAEANAEALLRGTVQQRKAHMQQLVVAVEDNSREEVAPTLRIPASPVRDRFRGLVGALLEDPERECCRFRTRIADRLLSGGALGAIWSGSEGGRRLAITAIAGLPRAPTPDRGQHRETAMVAAPAGRRGWRLSHRRRPEWLLHLRTMEGSESDFSEKQTPEFELGAGSSARPLPRAQTAIVRSGSSSRTGSGSAAFAKSESHPSPGAKARRQDRDRQPLRLPEPPGRVPGAGQSNRSRIARLAALTHGGGSTSAQRPARRVLYRPGGLPDHSPPAAVEDRLDGGDPPDHASLSRDSDGAASGWDEVPAWRSVVLPFDTSASASRLELSNRARRCDWRGPGWSSVLSTPNKITRPVLD